MPTVILGPTLLFLGLAVQGADRPPEPPGPPDPAWSFERDVRGLFRAQCFVCHGPDEQKGRLRLDQRASLFERAEPLVVPGAPDDSELLRRLSTTDADERMPKDRAPLSADAIARLSAWIADGAPWTDADERARHWAYVPPVRPSVPPVRDAAWCRNAIDRFVLARLEREGLAPAPTAERATLARRLFLDVTGLPPSPAEVEAFERDDAPDAPERLVARLLASPAYAERTAQAWLDLARYADTNGYEKDDRRTMWPWRDHLIAAFARDQGFDQFTLEAIAGDLLPGATKGQRLATAFHRNTLVNQEGGTDPEEFRCAAVIDRVNTTATVWLATTLACAQCHDHKYDPLSQRDYYRFFACFDGTSDTGNRLEPLLELPTADQERELAAIAARRAELARTLNASGPELAAEERAWEEDTRRVIAPFPAWTVLLPERARATGGSQLVPEADGAVLATGPTPERETYELQLAPKTPVRARVLRLEALVDATLPRKGPGRAANGNFVLTEIEVEVNGRRLAIAAGEADHEQHEGGSFPLRDAFDGDPKTGWAADAAAGHEDRRACFVLAEPVELGPAAALTVRLVQASPFPQHLLGRVRISATDDAALARRLRLPAARPWELAASIDVASTPAGLSTELGLEPGGARATEWTARSAQVDGHGAELPGEHVAHFLRRRFTCDADTSVRFAFGGDDGFRAWLDGELVAASDEWPGNLPAQVRVERALAAGAHELRVKVVNSSGPGQFWFDWDRKTRDRLDADVHALLLRPRASWSRAEAERVHAFWLGSISRRYVAVEAEKLRLDAREKALRATIVRVPVMEERAEKRVTHVFGKGSFLAPGAVVAPGAPAVFPPFPEGAPQNRLGLARWLVDPTNPLTARVAVNRVWERFFGRGLVATTEDFGTRGDAPSHPELLDWLALDFVEHGWSFQHLVRRITGSATYRQSSRASKALLERDPANVLLARSSAWRLDVETLRDSALACGGLLSPRVGGPSVMPPQPDGVWMPVYSNDAWATAEGEDRYRRGLYTFWKRSSPYATFMLFDAPSRELCSARRARTNTPLQALALLNDPAFVECAAGLAARMRDEGGATVAERLRFGFRVCTGRVPTERELDVLARLCGSELAAETARGSIERPSDPATAVVAGSVPVERARRLRALADEPEQRAWTRVANVLLNLDEALTRR